MNWWRMLFGESEAAKLRRVAKAKEEGRLIGKWAARRDWYAEQIEKQAKEGKFELNVPSDDADLFQKGAPGREWAKSLGLTIGGFGDWKGHGYQNNWPTLRW